MGLSPARRALTVELPLAVPYIVTGIRVAMVTTVGLVTVAAIVGQGGLGRLILDGLRRTFWTPMMVGASLSILLALTFDLVIWAIGRALTPWARAAHQSGKHGARAAHQSGKHGARAARAGRTRP
jgi:osmoprotectant transport system permease protein